MPKTLLRKTITFTVKSAAGERLFVDQFESATDAASGGGSQKPTAVRLLLRNGELVSKIDDSTFERTNSGERLTILHKG